MPINGKLISSLNNCWYLKDNKDLDLSAQERTIGILLWSLGVDYALWFQIQLFSAAIDCNMEVILCRSESLWLKKKKKYFLRPLLPTSMKKKSSLYTQRNQSRIHNNAAILKYMTSFHTWQWLWAALVLPGQLVHNMCTLLVPFCVRYAVLMLIWI